MLKQLIKELKQLSSHEKAKIYARFFKTGKGQYGEGDVFLGLTVPEQRKLAQKYVDLSFDGIKELLHSKYHEHRLTGLFILVYKYEKAKDNANSTLGAHLRPKGMQYYAPHKYSRISENSAEFSRCSKIYDFRHCGIENCRTKVRSVKPTIFNNEKQKIIDFYLKHRHRGNNWDLIDCVADKLLGKHIIDKDKSILYELAKSKSLWDRRIAIITTFEFIKNKKFEDTIRISEVLLNDKHDLIQKAVGWMLREMGKRDEKELIKFLNRHCRKMPRTMLRYAVEWLSSGKKQFYLLNC